MLPEEVLATTLVHHQHWFPVVTDKGALKEAFLAVVNTQPSDERLIAKNAERVVAARLRDAKFFWESDRKSTLESRLDRLHTIRFHKKLGSYRDKAERIERLAAWIAREAFGRADAAEPAARAARLAKADLASDMVFEFPELQGTMGGIYAREEGLPAPVWKAIYHHYLPVGVEADAPPSIAQLGESAVVWAAVSLADKLDTVVGLTAAGERATGSRDPFGLRRQMHGIVRILMDLPELTGIDRELGLRALHRGSGTRLRGSGHRLQPGFDRGVRTGARPVCARAARERHRGRAGRHLVIRRCPAAPRPARSRRAAAHARVRGLSGARGALQAREEHRPRVEVASRPSTGPR